MADPSSGWRYPLFLKVKQHRKTEGEAPSVFFYPVRFSASYNVGQEVTVLYIEKQNAIPVMDKSNPPTARCASGDCLTFQTKDCFGENIQSHTDLVHTVPGSEHNLATGPVYVEGAEPGDLLKVEIQKITLGDHGCQALIPGDGPLGRHIQEEYTKVFSLKNGYVEFNGRLRVPVSPMIGVIGTAPAGKGVANVTPGPHGSNMDNRKIQEGTILYLPVNVPGALLAMGDLHAVMGDGEVSTCGLEISGEITVRVSVVKNVPLPVPFLKTAHEYITIASGPDLGQAAQNACENMYAFLGLATELGGYERITLLSLVGNMEVCQVVNPQVTARMTVPSWVLDAYSYQLP